MVAAWEEKVESHFFIFPQFIMLLILYNELKGKWTVYSIKVIATILVEIPMKEQSKGYGQKLRAYQ